jgi:hypothetical protein
MIDRLEAQRTLMKIVEDAKGDDLERASRAKATTPPAILWQFEEGRRKWQDAYDLLCELLNTKGRI